MKKRKHSSFHLLSKKLGRSILRSPLQFLSILIITMLVSTLLNGFYGSAIQFEDQVNRAFLGSNTADIVTTLNVDEDNKDVNKDYKLILDTVGDRGKVETRSVTATRVNGFDNYVCLYGDYPTISKDNSFRGSRVDNFFVIDERYSRSSDIYGSGWKNKDGTYNPITVSFPITALKDDLGKVYEKFDKFVKTDKKNIFKGNFLNLAITPSGDMRNADNASNNEYFCAYSFLNRSLFVDTIKSSIEENFDLTRTPADEEEKKALDVLKDPKTYISDEYYSNNQYLTKLNNSNDTATVKEEIANAFHSKTSDNLLINIDRSQGESAKLLSNDAKQTKLLAITFSSIFVLVALLVTLTTFSQIILKERNEIGTLKALGVNNRKIILYYLCMGMIITLIGCIIGFIIGPTFIPPIFDLKFDSIYRLPSRMFVYPYLTVILSTLLFVGLTSIVIYLVTRKEVSLPPSFTLRSVLPKSVKSKSKKDKGIKLINYLYSTGKSKKELISLINNGKVSVNSEIVYKKNKKVYIFEDIVKCNDEVIKYKKNNKLIALKLALRNINCAIPKSIMVIVGIAGCSAILGGSFGVDDSMRYGLLTELDRFLTSDINLNFSYPDQSTVDQLKEFKETTHEISSYETFSMIPTTVSKSSSETGTFTTSVYAINPNSKFIHLGCQYPYARKVVVTKKVADALNLKKGTLIKFRALGEDYNGEVLEIIETFYMQGVFVSANIYQELSSAVTGLYIETNKDLVKSNKEFSEKLLKVPGVVSCFEYEKNYELMSSSLDTFEFITLILKLFATALAIVVLYNFVILNHKQRLKDSATLKVIGYNNFKVGLSMMIEILILSIIGITIGCFLSFPFEMLILSINKNDVIEFIFHIYPITYLYVILITLGTTFLVNFILIQKNKRIKMSESLKSIE